MSMTWHDEPSDLEVLFGHLMLLITLISQASLYASHSSTPRA